MKFIPAKHFTKGRTQDITLVVIHTAECGETAKADENVGAYFAGPNAPNASAHYMVDADSITKFVEESDTAWHAGPANGCSIGVEHAGYAKQTAAEWSDEYSMAMLDRSAEFVADICVRYEIPIRRLSAEDLKSGERQGLCGHIDVTNGLTNGKGHWDPGPNFPFDWYLERVQSYAAGRRDLKELPVPEPIASVKTPPNFDTFVEVEHDGVTWMVAPIYIAPVGIGEALELADRLGCKLPTPGLVDAIWRAADMKIDAAKMPIANHDGTPKTMNSAAAHATQAAKIAAQVGSLSLGVDYKLLAGAYKDVVLVDGKLGLYGWHRLNGTVIQPLYTGHALSWKDYSQGCRLVLQK